MRLNRLDLTRYGKFTDKVLDFGSRPAAGPDLHIVYGPNEAGKSTLFAGLLDLFYGIPPQSPYGFLHDYASMRIGAAIAAEGRERRFIRVKKQAGLLDGDERPLPEAAMSGLLGGLSRDDYRLMFSLDGDTLKKGGRDILASKGDLGQLLFSASAGLAGLSAKLTRIEEELDTFHKPGGRSGRLMELRRNVDELKRRRDEADVSASAFGHLEDAVQVAAEREATAAAAWRAATERSARIGLLRDGLRLAEDHAALCRDLAAAAAQAEALAPVLAIGRRADELGELGVVHRKALDDLPNRKAEAEAADAAVRALLGHLRRAGEVHPRSLLLDVAATATLRELIARKAPLDARLAAAQEAARLAARARDESAAALAERGAAGPEIMQVKAALEALRTGNAAARRKQAEAAVARAREGLSDALETLHPWQGDAAALAVLDAPVAADVTAAGTEITRLAAAEDAARQALERATTEAARQTAALAALGDSAALRDGADHGAIRTARETLWGAHRKALDAASADAFETALHRDDAATEARLTQAGAIATAAQLRVSAATAEADLKQAVQALEAAAARTSAARERLSGLVASVSPLLKPALSADALNLWLRQRDAALGIRAELREAEREAADAGRQEESLRDGLARALISAGIAMPEDADSAGLATAADDLLGKATAAEALRAGAERAVRDANDRAADLAAIEAEAGAWSKAWSESCASCWLGTIQPAPGPELVTDILLTLGELRNALDLRADKLDRLQKMERDLAAFEEQLAGLAAGLALDRTDGSLAVLRAVLDRVAEARAAEVTRERLAERHADAERGLLHGLRVATLAEADAILAGADAQALAAEQAELAPQLALLETTRLEAFSALSAARSALEGIGHDTRAALLAGQRANLLLEMGEEGSRHLSRRLGIMAMRQALRRYRDQHRSSMLEAASAAFALMTRGAYSGLRAQADRGTEKLIAIASEGSSKEADQLSTGTQYQLYLALRVAGHAEFARERPPLPFVCDDIFETFDDLRAEEAMRLLSGMATRGQVICLTHHRHLCGIAREVCPQVMLHEL